MSVYDILQATTEEVYVMEEARIFAIIAKFNDNQQKIAAGYDRQEILSRSVKWINASREGGLMLTV